MKDKARDPKAVSPAAYRLFSRFVDAALAGERCPLNNALGNSGTAHAAFRELVDGGFIRVESYGRNWRVVTILVGDHKDRRTAADPAGGKLARTLDHAGDRRSAPRAALSPTTRAEALAEALR